MEYIHDHGLFTWCEKRQQRISFLICLQKKCKHLKEKNGELICRFKSNKKLVEKRSKK